MTGDEEQIFEIGLAMSGAVSAGAYTAGVFDFLIQALDEWEKARGAPDVPNHCVKIKVMSGASAGAITAAIGTIALADAKETPLVFDPPRDGAQKIKSYLPKLYETWVAKPGLVAEQGQKYDFLQASDLEAPAKGTPDFSGTSGVIEANQHRPQVVSLLNSKLLDRIASDALDVQEVRDPRPYISEKLHVYMMLSNLRGIPYSVPFGNSRAVGEDCYHMISHGDRVHYIVHGLGEWQAKSRADGDKGRPIETGRLTDSEYSGWKDFATCCLASAAFPIGLAPRLIGAILAPQDDEYRGRHWPSGRGEVLQAPAWLADVLAEAPFCFTTADGGIVDNDPFEYTRFALLQPAASNHDGGKALPQEALELETSPSKAKRAVIMISPFPELKPIAPQGRPARDIVSIAKTLLPALIDQARFKPSEIIGAADPNDGSRYLIAPSRVPDDGPDKGKEQRFGIASGLLGGFGGFVARAFRDHDFQLGRRNCQRFLEEHFNVPGDHDIIGHWPAGAREEFVTVGPDGGKKFPLIPLCGSARPKVALDPWPRISKQNFEALQRRIAERFDAVAPRLLEENFSGLLFWLLKIAVSNLPLINTIRPKVLDYARDTILTDLIRRDMVEGFDLPSSLSTTEAGNAHLVLAELQNPAYDLRNRRGLGIATGLDQEAVQSVLNLGLGREAAGKDFEIWQAPWKDKAGGGLYTLKSRMPGGTSWFFWRHFRGIADKISGPESSAAWSKPKVDEPGL